MDAHRLVLQDVFVEAAGVMRLLILQPGGAARAAAAPHVARSLAGIAQLLSRKIDMEAKVRGGGIVLFYCTVICINNVFVIKKSGSSVNGLALHC